MATLRAGIDARGATRGASEFDRAAGKMKRSAGTATRSIESGFGSAMKRILAFGGAGGAAYMLKRFMSSAIKAAQIQEQAEIDLAAALEMTGDATKANMDSMKTYASGIQKVTIYGDELLLSQMAYVKNLGVATDQLQDATTAAVGLAAGYKLELATAMMLVGRASKGQTQMLTRYGIQLDDTLSPQEKFNRLLEIGAEKFVLAERAAESSKNSTVQLKMALGDTAEIIGDPLLPMIKDLNVSLTDLLTGKQLEIKQWVTDMKEGFETVYGVAKKLYDIQAKLQSLVSPEWASNLPSTTVTNLFDKFVYSRFPEHKTQYISGGLPGMQGQLPESEEDILNKRLQEVYGEPTEVIVPPSVTDKERAAAEKAAAEQAYQRTRITAQMYSDMGQLGTGYYESQKALIDLQKTDYKEFIGDKVLLDEWYTAKLNDLAIETSGFWQETITALNGVQGALSDVFMEMDNIGSLAESLAKSFQRMFANIAAQMAMYGTMSAVVGGKMAGQMGFSNPWAGVGKVALGGLLGGLFGGGAAPVGAGGQAFTPSNPYGLATNPVPSAMGNVFSNGRIVPMANGAILNRPTYFPMADGETGVAGEAGPELGFFPLRRNRGRLGIDSSGSSPNINVSPTPVKIVFVDNQREASIEALKSKEAEQVMIKTWMRNRSALG